RWNMLHPLEKQPRVPYVAEQLGSRKGPAVAATDYVRLFPEQIRPYLGDRRYFTLGTDGFGRSDMRSQLRRFFEVDRHYVAVAALHALMDEGEVEPAVVAQAIKAYRIDPDKANPTTV
ncbi:MAG: pyruvate dehydrogenase (acetyl-transferring), homodimeric type, partial [Gammaproteobacteria bacterium]